LPGGAEWKEDMSDLKDICYDEAGLVPAVVRSTSGAVLPLCHLNAEALEKSLDSGLLHRFSRRRGCLVTPSAQAPERVREVRLSGAGDGLLITIEPVPGAPDVFTTVLYRGGDAPQAPAGDILDIVYRVILERRDHPDRKSYVASLFAKGLDKILGKVGEEATETAVAGKGGDVDELIYEVADLFFHVLVLLGYYDVSPARIYDELRRRFGVSGIVEKAGRARPADGGAEMA